MTLSFSFCMYTWVGVATVSEIEEHVAPAELFETQQLCDLCISDLQKSHQAHAQSHTNSEPLAFKILLGVSL